MDSGALTWRMKTVDPETGDWPEDALAGFLPPNDDTGRGEGHVTFRIMPKPDSLNGTIITNMATIVFDTEAAIDTNEVQNLIGVFADVDGSATVNAIDVQLVINEALGISTGYQCDLNGDDQVNALDVQLVINAALGIET